MKKTTSKICDAFMQGKTLRVNNSYTDGSSLFLFDNKIAEQREDGLWITNAGWQSNTTKERLNGLDGVSISQKKGVWYLNGNEWDGQWIRVSDGRASESKSSFAAVAMVAQLGSIMCDNKADQNKWKQRMIKAGMGEGISLPDDWDELSEDEKERRLNGVIEVMKENK